MDVIYLVLIPILFFLFFIFQVLHNRKGLSDIRVVNSDAFAQRFDDSLDNLLRDGIIREYRHGTNVYHWLSRGSLVCAVMLYITLFINLLIN